MAKADTNQPLPEKRTKSAKKDYIFAVGRRRESVARVRLYPENKMNVIWGDTEAKKGEIWVNQKAVSAYFSGDIAKAMLLEPFRVTNTLNKYITTVRVAGGGPAGQLDAVIHGIARALSSLDEEKFHPILKKRGFLTRDARVRERRKVGTGGKARRKKQSPKR